MLKQCYQFNMESNKKTWHDARDYCINHGGNLASILSEKEQGECQAFLDT